MPRDIPIGNNRLLVCFDKDYTIRDLYFPHVGQENHVSGDQCRMGLWVDNKFSWVGPDWRIDMDYQAETLVSSVSLLHKELQVLITCRDAVDFHENIYLREITIENLHPQKREVRLFFSQGLNISGNNVGDTAAFDPKTGGIVHYKGNRYFLINGSSEGSEIPHQFAVGQINVGGRIGTYKDAEDGVLSANPIAQGSVDSVIGLHLSIDGNAQGQAHYWLAAGESWAEVRRLDAVTRNKTPRKLLKRTADYWRLWVKKETPVLDVLPEKVRRLYLRSLLVLATQIDSKGGILAANDSDVIQFNRDTYSYVWLRDGALIANAIDAAGYPIISQRFYSFASEIIEKEGYFLHKYNPDGTLASSWHPWSINGQEQLPIQEDETALVLWALWNHFVRYRDIEFIKPLYLPLIKRAADFLASYRDEETGLPAPSYDLWEERYGILSFTVGTVFGGLTAASLFCRVFGEDDRADRYQQIASEIRDAASKHLWKEDLQRFCRMVYRENSGKLHADPSCDASLWGLFAFGMYDAKDPRIEATIKTLRSTLWLPTDVGGMARYEGDSYYREDDRLTGNPWFICTLWLADYMTQKAEKEHDLQESIAILEWVADHALPSGVLAEQVHPLTGQPLSVSPLTWSHATFVNSCQKLIRTLARMKKCEVCGHSLLDKPAGKEDWLAQLYGEACDTIHGICKV